MSSSSRNLEPGPKPAPALEWFRSVRPVIYGLALIIALTFTLVTELAPATKVDLEAGDVADQDILAPRSISYISQVLTERAREEAAAAVRDVYDQPDMRVARAQVSYTRQVLAFIETVRSDGLAGRGRQRAYLQAVPDLDLTDDTMNSLLSLTAREWESVREDTVSVVDQAMREEVRPDRLQQIQAGIPLLVRLEVPEKQALVITALAQQLIVPNTTRNAQATALARQQALAAVQPVRQSFDINSTIVHQGEQVDEADIEAMEQFGLLHAERDWRDLTSLGVAVTVLVTLLALYIQRFYARFLTSDRHLSLISLILVFFTVAAKLMVPGRAILPFLFPASAAAMLLTSLFDSHLAIGVTIVLAAMVGLIGGNSLELALFVAMGGITAALYLRKSPRISAFFRAGVVVAVVNMAIVLVYRLGNSDLLGILQLLGASFLNGLLSAGITLVGFYVVGTVFQVVTSLQLQELARLDHPLLQELLRQAPGTYHHSLMVSNLAEQAARRIGADSDLVRVGSFYHDVGKVARPYFFTENQTAANAHSRLDPLTSAEIITSHVRDGVELARRYRLPDKIRAFIPEHQGTRVVKSFYHRALQAADDPATVNADDYRYPGPRPQSRETALVLLADSCEAATTAMQTQTGPEIERVVGQVITDIMTEGELDESGLTLGDIHLIKQSFVESLHGRFHTRPKHPGQRTSDQLRARTQVSASDGERAMPSGG